MSNDLTKVESLDSIKVKSSNQKISFKELTKAIKNEYNNQEYLIKAFYECHINSCNETMFQSMYEKERDRYKQLLENSAFDLLRLVEMRRTYF